MTNTAIPETAPMTAARLALAVATKRLLRQRGGEIRFRGKKPMWPSVGGPEYPLAGIRLSAEGQATAFLEPPRGQFEIRFGTASPALLGGLPDALERECKA